VPHKSERDIEYFRDRTEEICKLYSEGYKRQQLAGIFSVKKEFISEIINKQNRFEEVFTMGRAISLSVSQVREIQLTCTHNGGSKTLAKLVAEFCVSTDTITQAIYGRGPYGKPPYINEEEYNAKRLEQKQLFYTERDKLVMDHGDLWYADEFTREFVKKYITTDTSKHASGISTTFMGDILFECLTKRPIRKAIETVNGGLFISTQLKDCFNRELFRKVFLQVNDWPECLYITHTDKCKGICRYSQRRTFIFKYWKFTQEFIDLYLANGGEYIYIPKEAITENEEK
jgi:hypothetical protein